MEKKPLSQDIIEEKSLTLTDFCQFCGAEEHYIIEMVEMGILDPEGKTVSNWRFSILHIQRFQKAQRLQHDLNLNLAGVALSLELIDELKQLREDINNLEHQLKLFTQI